MKPLNYSEQGCTPTSSNCVIWQGPDIECINLCNGDSISDVTYKLALEICAIKETLSVNTYEDVLTCFNIKVCPPQNFDELMEFILARICNLEKCTGCIPDCEGNSEMDLPASVTTNCCDTLVDVAECFYYINGVGDEVTQLSLSTYVHSIGNKVCTIEQVLTTLGLNTGNIAGRVANLENQPAPTCDIPQIIPQCVLPSNLTDIDIVVQALEQQFCALRQATGTDAELYSGMAVPTGLDSDGQLCANAPMSAILGWVYPAVNAADVLNNMWLTIMDLRCGVKNALLCCPTGCSSISITMYFTITGSQINIFLIGTIPPGFNDCGGLGTLFVITDSMGNSYNRYIDVTSSINATYGIPVNLSGTGVDVTLDLTVTATACFENGDHSIHCEKYLSYYYANTAICPVLSTVSGITTINWQFMSVSGTKTYDVQLWSSDGSTMITSQSITVTGVALRTGIFTGLAGNTTYLIRIAMTVGSVTTNCPFVSVSTLPLACDPPTDVAAVVVITPVP